MKKIRWLQIGALLLLGLIGSVVDAKTLVITGEQLNVRSGPDRTDDIVAVVKKNEKFEILSKQGEWYQISVEGTPGWVSEKAIRVLDDRSLSELLAQADRYFQRNQFTTPPEANAYDLYREVLQRDPENAHAHKRIAQMARTYKIWGERASQQREYENARIFYQRYLFLIPDDQEVLKLLDQLEHSGKTSDNILQIRQLRSDPIVCSPQSVVAMVQKYGFHHPADWSKHALSPSITGNMRHDYKVIDSQGASVIIDHVTGLMWQQVGTAQPMSWATAFEYAAELNRQRYAGFANWRIPTIEELTSLMEPEKTTTNLYLSPLFGNRPLWCWSADRSDSRQKVWYVSFSSGGIQQLELDNKLFVLAVRTYSVSEK